MSRYSLSEPKGFLTCQRCRGQVIRSYTELFCLQCGAPHTEEGKLATYRAEDLGLQLRKVRRRRRRLQTEEKVLV